MKQVIVDGLGLKAKIVEQEELKPPKEGCVTISHECVGVNPIDFQKCSNIYATEFPFVPGTEAVGIVKKLGKNVTSFKVNDRVAYCNATGGAYCESRNINASLLVKVPDNVSSIDVAASLYKLMTAHYLMNRVYLTKNQLFILIHNAASSDGYLLCKFAREFKNHYIIGLVNSENEAEFATRHGCNDVLFYSDEKCIDKIMERTNYVGVPAAYDSVASDLTSKISLHSLQTLGIYMIYGYSGGKAAFISTKSLHSRSTIVTSTSVQHYKNIRLELALTAHEIFKVLPTNLRPIITKQFSLDEAQNAMELVSSPGHMGSVVLNVK